MNGFKNSTRMRSGFSYPSSAGFSTSTGKMQNISYSRKTPRRGPAKFAEGGTVVRSDRPRVRGSSVEGKSALGALRDAVIPHKGLRWQGVDSQVDRMTKAKGGAVIDSSLHSFKDDSQVNVEHGPKGGLRPGFAKGGKWIAKATKNKGALHRALHVPEGEKIPAKKLAKAAHSDNPTMRKRAALAKTLKSLHKARGGDVAKYAKGGRIPASKVADRAARAALARHEATPAPRGHKGLGAKLKGC